MPLDIMLIKFNPFLILVNDFVNQLKPPCYFFLCGEVCWTAVQHTSPHRTHVHTPNVMLPHHHNDLHF